MVTFILTRVYLAYTVAPFVLLSMESGLKMYAKQYFFGHILCLLVIFVVPVVFPAPKRPTPSAADNGKKPILEKPKSS